MKRKYDDAYDKAFGEYFTELRISKGIKRQYVADKLAIKVEALLTYEHGTRSCPISVFKALCEFYSLDIVDTFKILEAMATSEAKK